MTEVIQMNAIQLYVRMSRRWEGTPVYAGYRARCPACGSLGALTWAQVPNAQTTAVSCRNGCSAKAILEGAGYDASLFID